ncbi:hypothetical protein H3H39_19150 [Duganella sp. LX47W]|uniref:Uncharacterized protein n=1 Tax=Rugamonas apoptosis TaxID=2758570 RepID=A0A7W2IM15_9BURK|nr:hypothetical protein [Rugamonas apoptosis]
MKPEEWGKVEGSVADMPWLVAKERFVGFFKDPRRGSGLFEHVEKNHGCNAANATDWAVAMNSVITILNTIPDGATEAEVMNAFGL